MSRDVEPIMTTLLPTSIPVPLPEDWARIHSVLCEARTTSRSSHVPEPPGPLILAGAAFSKASAIRRRWVDLIQWANQYGFAEVLGAHLSPPPDFDVAEHLAGVSEDGRGWWREFGEE
jgi:hypothetical protein